MTSTRKYPTEPCPVYHIHDDGSWEWGAVCNRSPSHFVEPSEEQLRLRSIRWNLKQMGDSKHRTVREEVQEHYDRARADGRDITKV